MSLGQTTVLLSALADGLGESLRCLGHRDAVQPVDEETQKREPRRVAVDSTTLVPMSLYRELAEAGEAARARGQHQLQRRQSSLSDGTESTEIDQRPRLVLSLGASP
mmetsp:Transcript_9090/g.20217  ORF Transcript_9090/g.20217 Transcript_9090/m.20217 type:complete len:107 (+) Transcript_9090:113-433(+)|eukprot:CAMPEP_0178440638 /NCGR_PEP_ID=MMETSP0689_2-20121128/36908_1 /TAXON_ID=160604 /ORGANISM="Amphidinium massartii, Strain CS-259" /LENGTH=106 /DNA_ID=CAMNT_0020063471 /DNA_START=30 /DNA_END=350 /DNA_ORIENTATION=+